jgi:NAD(P)-dependent dehydrogenase (short-subunit alcohol dehydrogenase family)
MDDQVFSSVFRVNNTGVFYTVVALLPLLEAGNAKGNVEQKPQVIATSSVASFNRAAFSGFAYSG